MSKIVKGSKSNRRELVFFLRLGNKRKKLGFDFQCLGMVTSERLDETLQAFDKHFPRSFRIAFLFPNASKGDTGFSRDGSRVTKSEIETLGGFLSFLQGFDLSQNLEGCFELLFCLRQQIQIHESEGNIEACHRTSGMVLSTARLRNGQRLSINLQGSLRISFRCVTVAITSGEQDFANARTRLGNSGMVLSQYLFSDFQGLAVFWKGQFGIPAGHEYVSGGLISVGGSRIRVSQHGLQDYQRLSMHL
mmetsp:Transcript_5815/g.14003  ORF Transcript_5815/g.14003 Transcript_5815/m.14003 type:complete len:248 (+) Transcript_5815:2-745(+)